MSATERAAARAMNRQARLDADVERLAAWHAAAAELDAAERVLRAARSYRDDKRRVFRRLSRGLYR